MSKKLKLSPWHSGNVKPVHVGVYQKKNYDGLTWYSFWNGERFSKGCINIDLALHYKDEQSIMKVSKWRGILK